MIFLGPHTGAALQRADSPAFMVFGEDPLLQGFHRSLSVCRGQTIAGIDKGFLLLILADPALLLIALLVQVH